MRQFVLACVLMSAACATSAPVAGAFVVSGDGHTLHDGPAAWTVRATSTGREDVVFVAGVGEIIVGADGCRLVRALPGGAIAILPAARSGPCTVPRNDRLCFPSGTRFAGDGIAVDVAGCADKNELFLDRLADGAVATVGPTAFVERCVPLPSTSPTWLRVRAILVEDNDRPEHGLHLRYRDGFQVCFLTRPRGRYRVEVDVEDPQRRRISLDGHVGDEALDGPE
jgi:hypothetical protein